MRPTCTDCDGHVHSFVCFMGRFATDFTPVTASTGRASNAR